MQHDRLQIHNGVAIDKKQIIQILSKFVIVTLNLD